MASTAYNNSRRCLVRGCGYFPVSGLPTLHVFPKEKNLRDLWVKFVQRTKCRKWSGPSPGSTICSLHFKDEDFENLNVVKMGFGRRLRLRKEAVPVIYPKNCVFVKSKETPQEKDNGKIDIEIEEDEDINTTTKYESTLYTYLYVSERKPPDDDYAPVIQSKESTGGKNNENGNDLEAEDKMSKSSQETEMLSENTPSCEPIEPSKPPPSTPPNKLKKPRKRKRKPLKVRFFAPKARAKFCGVMNENENTEKSIKESTILNQENSEVKEEEDWDSSTAYFRDSNICQANDMTDCMDNYIDEMLQSMYSMQQKGKLCDFTLSISPSESNGLTETTSIKVHRLVFATVSNRIRRFQKDTIKLGGKVKFNDILHVVEFVYTGKMRLIKTFSALQVMRICNAAAALDVMKCVKYLEIQRPDAVELAIPQIREQPSTSYSEYDVKQEIDQTLFSFPVEEEIGTCCSMEENDIMTQNNDSHSQYNKEGGDGKNINSSEEIEDKTESPNKRLKSSPNEDEKVSHIVSVLVETYLDMHNENLQTDEEEPNDVDSPGQPSITDPPCVECDINGDADDQLSNITEQDINVPLESRYRIKPISESAFVVTEIMNTDDASNTTELDNERTLIDATTSQNSMVLS